MTEFNIKDILTEEELQFTDFINPQDSVWYQNIVGLKKKDVKINFQDWQIDEIEKCKNDFIYFINNYVKVKMLDKGIQQIELRDYQIEYLECLDKYRYTIAMMPRQMGKTSSTDAYFCWCLLFKSDYKIMVLANTAVKATEIISELKTMIMNLPPWMQEGITAWNGQSIGLENGSSIFAKATTPNAGRGGTVDIVYIDEMAFIEDSIMSDLIKAVFPTITSGQKSKFIITSTPAGRNLFWKMYTDACGGVEYHHNPLSVPGKNEFKAYFAHWTRMKTRDEAFKQSIINKFGLAYWRREYECFFDGSSNTYIPGELLERMYPKNPLIEEDFYGTTLKVYEDITDIANKTYVITVDPSEGLGLDNTAIIVWEIGSKFKEVATVYDANLTDDAITLITYKLAMKFNGALVVPEINNGFGMLLVSKLQSRYSYEYIVYDTKLDNFGFKTTRRNKPKGLSSMKKFIETDKLVINDYSHIHELNVFVQKGNTYAAAENEHDDLVMSTVLLCYILSDEDYYNTYISLDDKEFQKNILNMEDENEPVIMTTRSFENRTEQHIDKKFFRNNI